MPREDVHSDTEHDAGRYERFVRGADEDDRPVHEQYEPGDEL